MSGGLSQGRPQKSFTMSQPKLPEPWWPETIRLMVEDGLPMEAAATNAGYNIGEDELHATARSRLWREHLDAAMRAYYASLYQTVGQDKAVLLGEMVALARKSRDQGKNKDAADTLMNVAKAEGIAGSDTSVSIFNEVSGADLQRALAAVREKRAAEAAKKPN